VYDVSNNYAADTVLGGQGDVRFLLGNLDPRAVHAGAWILMIAGVWAAIRHIQRTSEPERGAAARAIAGRT
jgi:hypothetical protein